MNTAWKNSGHKISFVFERDPERGRDEIEAMLLPQRKSIARTGILRKTGWRSVFSEFPDTGLMVLAIGPAQQFFRAPDGQPAA
ncbi:hypothetical protein, partial [Shigella sonnei]|uniref:hypothetical protein n=1 Tax=Shigella sonnei TaxID=624 RepID=UPI00069C0C60